MTDLNTKMSEKQSLVDSINIPRQYYTAVNIPNQYQSVTHTPLNTPSLEFEKQKVFIFREPGVLKRNLYLTFITLLIVFILCFTILGILSFIDIIKNNDMDDDI